MEVRGGWENLVRFDYDILSPTEPSLLFEWSFFVLLSIQKDKKSFFHLSIYVRTKFHSRKWVQAQPAAREWRRLRAAMNELNTIHGIGCNVTLPAARNIFHCTLPAHCPVFQYRQDGYTLWQVLFLRSYHSKHKAGAGDSTSHIQAV